MNRRELQNNDGKNIIKNSFTWVELPLTKAIPVVLKVYERVWIKKKIRRAIYLLKYVR